MIEKKSISKQSVTELFDSISSTYDRINRVLSFGIDLRWRKALLKEISKQSGQVAVDLATGTGDQILALSKSPYIDLFYGFDLSLKMLHLAEKKTSHLLPQKKISLQLGNALQVPLSNHFCDITTISFGIRNTQDPNQCLSEMYRILKPKGVSLVLEFSLPKSKLVRTPYLFYLRHLLPKLGGFLSKNFEAYSYLNKTIESFPSGDAFLQMMRSHGFSQCKQIPLSFGIASLYVGKKE